MECEVEPLRIDQPRILVVDDEPLIRMAVADALRDQGITVVEAATADEAWQHLLIDNDIDVVFTDHRMPGSMQGAELVANIRDRWPALPAILTSGDFDGQGYRGEVLRKPYDVVDVASDLAAMARLKRRRISS